MSQLTIFDTMYQKYKITRPIRLIELFGGYGSQALALKYLGVEFEHWKLVEWAVKSIQAYKDIHFTNDNEDYSMLNNLSYEKLIDILYNYGISQNYNEPMALEQIKRLGENQVRKIFNNIVATHNLVNIQKVKGYSLEIVDTDKYEYIMTYSFPCQDLSLAGKGKGMSDTSTRSGMLWEVERILTECKDLGTMPQILLMENVPQVHSLDNMPDFHKWQVRLGELGYKNYWQDLIATDYEIPQTRNRCFMVSILGDYSYTFPKPIPLKLKLKDMLEDNVDEKYYLSEKGMKYICGNACNPNLKDHIDRSKAKLNKEIAYTINTKQDRRCGDANFILDGYDEITIEQFLKLKNNLKPKKIGSLYEDRQAGSIYSENAMCPTLTTESSNNWNILLGTKNKSLQETLKQNNIKDTCYIDTYNKRIDEEKSGTIITGVSFRNNTFLAIKNATKKGYLEATDGDGIDISSRMEHHRGTVQKGKSQTLTTQCEVGVINSDLRIRKLTPRECFRLMGVRDEDFEKCAKNQSDSSLYHLAGDSIVINVLMAIFKELLWIWI